MASTPLIISTDPGIDDIAALTISLFAEKFAVRLLVPTWGNAALEYTLQNTLNLEKFLDTKVPVIEGASRPLVAPRINAASVHGRTGLSGYHFAEANNDLVNPILAATAMYNEIMDTPQKVTLLGIGPLTDYALLLHQYPNVIENIAQVVLMGGNLGRGNHSPLTEFNIAADPEAAHIVFNSNLPIKMVPLEIGNQAKISKEDLNQIQARGEVGNMLASLFSHLHEPDGQVKVYDPTAVAAILQADLFTWQPASVNIELRGQYTYGASVVDFNKQKTNAQVAVQVNVKAFKDWFIKAIGKAEQGRKING